jgi:hypothetical protein
MSRTSEASNFALDLVRVRSFLRAETMFDGETVDEITRHLVAKDGDPLRGLRMLLATWVEEREGLQKTIDRLEDRIEQLLEDSLDDGE